MKIIQSIADIEKLKERSALPTKYIKIIEDQFLEWYESENEGEPLVSFRLPNHTCMYHLENENDGEFIYKQLIHLEFVDVEENEEVKYLRMGIMDDHQMHLVYVLEGTLEPSFEEWLKN